MTKEELLEAYEAALQAALTERRLLDTGGYETELTRKVEELRQQVLSRMKK